MEEIIRLRGHHILCLLGFRGLGYDGEFVENMTRVHTRIFSSEAIIRITEGPDDICRACPKLEEGRCGGDGSRVAGKDASVLSLLSLKASDSLPASEVYARVSRLIGTEALGQLCKNCRWLSLGYCTEGLAGLSTCVDKGEPAV